MYQSSDMKPPRTQSGGMYLRSKMTFLSKQFQAKRIPKITLLFEQFQVEIHCHRITALKGFKPVAYKSHSLVTITQHRGDMFLGSG